MAEKQNRMDSVRKQWTEQRKGGHRAQGVPAASGSHFAKPPVAPETDPLRTAKNPNAARAVPPAPMGGRPAQPVAGGTGAPRQAYVQGAAQQRHVKISGASGELPSVGMHVKRQKAIPYSRFNKRYIHRPEKFSVVRLFSTEAVKGAPAYAKAPFLAYGLVGVIVTVIWCVLVKMTAGTPVAGGTELTVGLAWLCLAVVAGLVLVAATSMVTRRTLPDAAPVDIVASALGKTACSMLVIVVVWVGASAVLTGISL